MVRIGKPLGFYQCLNRFGHPEPRWVVPRCGWVALDLWTDLEDFQSPMPPLPPNYPPELIAQAIEDTKKWNEVPWAAEVDRKIRLNPERGVVWNLVMRSGYGLVSEVTVLGQEHLVPWTWFEERVGYPLLCGFCSIANFFHLRVLEPIRKLFGFKPRFYY